MSETYLYSINRVINIDNGENANTTAKRVVFGTDANKIYKNLIDSNITTQCRIIGGTWTDNLVVNNIVCHPNSEDTSYGTHSNNILNIALPGNNVNMAGCNINITSIESNSKLNIYGKTINIGEDVSTTTIKTNIMNITTPNQTSTTTINGKTLNLSENNIAGTIVNLYGKALNIGENDTITTLKSNTTTITTPNQASFTTINGKFLTLAESNILNSTTTLYGQTIKFGENNRSDTDLTVFGKTITVGNDTNTSNLNIYSDHTLLKTDLTLSTTTSNYTLNTTTDGAYLKLQKNVTNSKAQIDMGNLINTNKINIEAQNININAQCNLSLATSGFIFNENSQKAFFEINDAESRITIGRAQLKNTIIHGSNIAIGEPGCTTTIYGNVISYSQGSNIITNTLVQETSAFHIHNTGTKTALTVIQDNKVSGGQKDLVNFFTQSNQDRSPFRVDHVGRVGMGVSTSSNLKAWLHINRNDPYISSLVPDDLLLIEDIDNDATPFIVKKEGDVGIGTDVPRYKLDVWSGTSELNGQTNNSNIINAKGIAFRDVVYIKQHHTNRIMFGFGNKLYLHPNTTHSCLTGFNFTWIRETGTGNVYANKDNTGFDPFTPNTDGTFTFRMTCKLHIAGSDGNMAYRRFEIFVNPQNNTFSGKQMPAHVTVADLFESSYDHYEFPIEPRVIKLDNTKCQLQIKWKLRDTTGNTVMPAKSRAYLDVEFFGHENIGDIKAEPINQYDLLNDGNFTNVI
jgi:hypothetical protein